MVNKLVYLVEAKRTPQVKAGLELKDVAAPFLGSSLLRSILDSTDIPNSEVDEVIVGNTGAPAKYANVSRVIALIAGLDQTISASTVHRNCASGMESISTAYNKKMLH